MPDMAPTEWKSRSQPTPICQPCKDSSSWWSIRSSSNPGILSKANLEWSITRQPTQCTGHMGSKTMSLTNWFRSLCATSRQFQHWISSVTKTSPLARLVTTPWRVLQLATKFSSPSIRAHDQLTRILDSTHFICRHKSSTAVKIIRQTNPRSHMGKSRTICRSRPTVWVRMWTWLLRESTQRTASQVWLSAALDKTP